MASEAQVAEAVEALKAIDFKFPEATATSIARREGLVYEGTLLALAVLRRSRTKVYDPKAIDHAAAAVEALWEG